MIDRKIMNGKTGRLPAIGRMAHLTAKTKIIRMDMRLLMARSANCLYVIECLSGMAGRTIQLRMFSVKDEDGRMIEISHPVDAVMTFRAGLPERQ